MAGVLPARAFMSCMGTAAGAPGAPRGSGGCLEAAGKRDGGAGGAGPSCRRRCRRPREGKRPWCLPTHHGLPHCQPRSWRGRKHAPAVICDRHRSVACTNLRLGMRPVALQRRTGTWDTCVVANQDQVSWVENNQVCKARQLVLQSSDQKQYSRAVKSPCLAVVGEPVGGRVRAGAYPRSAGRWEVTAER